MTRLTDADLDRLGHLLDQDDIAPAHRLNTIAGLLAECRARGRERDEARRRWDRQSDRWCVMTPDDTLWFDTRNQAEDEAADWMDNDSQCSGEAREDQCVILAVVSTTAPIVGSTKDDDTPDGQLCRDNGWDHIVSGYRVEPGAPGIYRDDYVHPLAAEATARAEAAEAEVERLRALIADPGDMTWAWVLAEDDRIRLAHVRRVNITVPGHRIADHLRGTP